MINTDNVNHKHDTNDIFKQYMTICRCDLFNSFE